MSPTSGPEFAQLKIERGTCYILFVYDVALSIDLIKVERHATQTTQRQSIKPGKRRPKHLEYNPPLRLTEEAAAVPIGALQTNPAADLLLYEFGAVMVVYSVDIRGPFSTLAELSLQLYDNETLLADSKARVERFLQYGEGVVQRHGISETVEDYVIFHIESLAEPLAAQRLIADNEQAIAQILRAEAQMLSSDEVQMS